MTVQLERQERHLEKQRANRQAMAEEQERREQQECTFQPATRRRISVSQDSSPASHTSYHTLRHSHHAEQEARPETRRR